MLNKFLKILIPIVVLGVASYQFRDALAPRVMPVLEDLKSLSFFKDNCEDPIPYNIGTFASEFNVSQKYFLEAIAEAEAIWEEPFGKELFAYAPEDNSYDVLKINLIYDHRQETTSKLSNIGGSLNEDKAKYNSLKSKLDALVANYEKEKNSFNERVLAFNKKMEAYQAKVIYWNERGGAPQKEYDEIQETRRELEQESKSLETAENSFGVKQDEINKTVAELNQLAKELNISVEKYNVINESRGETFEEGNFISQGSKRQIDIYEFSNRTKLVRVLAHEFGHSLGLEHVPDKKAIMYELNEDKNMKLTADDLQALQVKCAE